MDATLKKMIACSLLGLVVGAAVATAIKNDKLFIENNELLHQSKLCNDHIRALYDDLGSADDANYELEQERDDARDDVRRYRKMLEKCEGRK